MTDTTWLTGLLTALPHTAALPDGACEVALDAAYRDKDRAALVRLARAPGLPASARSRLLADRSAVVRAALLGRTDLTDDEAAALLEGETRIQVLDAGAAHARRTAGPEPEPVIDPNNPVEAIWALCMTAFAADDVVPDELTALLAAHPDLAGPALTYVYGRARRPAVLAAIAASPEFTDAILEETALPAFPHLAGHLLGMPDLADPFATALARTAADLQAGPDADRYTWWDVTLTCAYRSHGHGALTPTAVAILADALAADPTLAALISHSWLLDVVPDLVDGWDGTGPNACRWADDAARDAWVVGVAEHATAWMLMDLPTALLAAVFDTRPYSVLHAACSQNQAAAELAGVVPDVVAGWPAGDPRWAELLDGFAAEAGAGPGHLVATALLAAPAFDLALTRGRPAFDRHVPTDAAARAAWPPDRVVAAVHGAGPELAAGIAADLDALDVRAAELLAVLGPAWPGTWGELLRACQVAG